MSSVNKVVLIGNLGRDPEVRRLNNGNAVVSFSLACSESWRDKATGERKERTEWVNVVIFNDAIGKVAEAYCKKGSKVYLEGQLQTREFTDKDGNQRKVTEVVLQRFRGELTLLDGRKDEGESPARREAPDQTRAYRREDIDRAAGRGRAPIDDDILFSMEWR
jgi:single-strand DNA-binding protein